MQVLLEELSESLDKLSEKSSEAELEESFRLVMAARGDNKVLSINWGLFVERRTGMNPTPLAATDLCKMPVLQPEAVNTLRAGVEGGTGHGLQDFPGQQTLAQHEDGPVVHPVIFTHPCLNTAAHHIALLPVRSNNKF